jgi:hypothetical protein
MEIRVEIEIYIDGNKEKTFGLNTENLEDAPLSLVKIKGCENLDALLPEAKKYIEGL